VDNGWTNKFLLRPLLITIAFGAVFSMLTSPAWATDTVLSARVMGSINGMMTLYGSRQDLENSFTHQAPVKIETTLKTGGFVKVLEVVTATTWTKDPGFWAFVVSETKASYPGFTPQQVLKMNYKGALVRIELTGDHKRFWLPGGAVNAPCIGGPINYGIQPAIPNCHKLIPGAYHQVNGDPWIQDPPTHY
jgi:hypothetical protein